MKKRSVLLAHIPAKEKNLLQSLLVKPRKLKINHVHIYPPTRKRTTWRLQISANGIKKQRSGGNTVESIYSAFLDLDNLSKQFSQGFDIDSELSEILLTQIIFQFINQGGPKHAWKDRTRKDRQFDLKQLVLLAQKLNLKAKDLNQSHIKTFICTGGTYGRGQSLKRVVRTFLNWGHSAGYFSQKQVDLTKQIIWSPPLNSKYRKAPSRRLQSQIHSATTSGLGGEVPTHEQVEALANELQKYYKQGKGLVISSAYLGTRAHETLIYTADKAVAKRLQGNYVNIEEQVVEIFCQLNDDPTQSMKTTKNNKMRSVVIPNASHIYKNFDLLSWLEARCQEALQEQKAGINDLALLFPNSVGRVIELNNFRQRNFNPAADALGWKMTEQEDAFGNKRSMRRFTLHSLRDHYGTTAADEWGYTERQLLQQGSWTDPETVRKFYLGTTDETLNSVKQLHKREE